jgi:hypothetical protein
VLTFGSAVMMGHIPLNGIRGPNPVLQCDLPCPSDLLLDLQHTMNGIIEHLILRKEDKAATLNGIIYFPNTH